ncbi:hypothetical protein J4H92_09945 [Leucobacter weissii]|uniref:Uncharacterized protein n=1 Tax=Leucobacter weissii TaxID=1983706 RepID=A0A939MKI3_9MICO|nr:hypothetical protein [Leucobacter weissii]MBO1902266.1 hypothetical protein [Leucobacter weissii]
MTDSQPSPQLPSPKILLPLGIVLIVGAVLAFALLELHLVTGALAGLLGIVGVVITVQSITRLVRGER